MPSDDPHDDHCVGHHNDHPVPISVNENQQRSVCLKGFTPSLTDCCSLQYYENWQGHQAKFTMYTIDKATRPNERFKLFEDFWLFKHSKSGAKFKNINILYLKPNLKHKTF